jgi:hypothetical protein
MTLMSLNLIEKNACELNDTDLNFRIKDYYKVKINFK